MAKRQGLGSFRPKLISIAVASCFVTSTALANPTGPTVVNGTAAILQTGNLLQVTNSPSAIINWQSFSIGASEITRFIQQSQASAVLNRVTGSAGVIDPSVILGALQSNGRVFLINPSGILFGAGAQIDVAGLVASSLKLSDADFLGNRMRFTDGIGAGNVTNLAKPSIDNPNAGISTPSGGSVYLVGNSVTNSGVITTPQGEVVLAAGNSVELVNPGTPNLRVEIVAPDNQALNLGQIVADAGRIGIYAGLINQAGTIRANSAVATEDGRIVLKATKNTTLEAGSVTTANGPTGGSITVQSGDTTLVAGTVEAKGLGSPPSEGGVAPAGDGVVGKGGTIHLLGNLVGLIGDASINASGDTGGGTVLVGGDFQGKNPDVQNAYRTFFGSNATINADAGTSGDGGKVIVWSDDATRAYGTITARGGAQSGDGGFVEVSGKKWLDFAASVNTSAPWGASGTLLLDPSDVEIIAGVAGGGGFNSGNPDNIFNGGASFSQVGWDTIKTNLIAANVYITTSGAELEAGNILVSAASPDLSTLNKLQLVAHNNITVNGDITNTGGGTVALYAGWCEVCTGSTPLTPNTSSGGSIILNAPITVNATSGEVHLIAGDGGSGISQAANAPVTANKLLANGGRGTVAMDLATNMVNFLAGKSVGSDSFSGKFLFRNGKSLTIDTVGGVSGITVETSRGDAEINVTVTNGGGITVLQPVTAVGNDDGNRGPGAFITLNAEGGITVGSAIVAQGGFGSSDNGGGVGGAAVVTLTAAAGLNISNNITARAGSGDTNGGAATVNLAAAGSGITIGNGSNLIAFGGRGVEGNGGAATINLCAGSLSGNTCTPSSTGGITVASSQVLAVGGQGSGVGGDALVQLVAGSGGIQVAGIVSLGSDGEFGNGTILAQGGQGSNPRGGNATVTLNTTGSISVGDVTNGEGRIEAVGGGGNGGNGGDGGAATVTLTASSISLTNSSSISATGGSGDSGGNSGSAGGNGGAALVTLTGGTISLASSDIDADGGDGGDGQSAFEGGIGGRGGNGGNATVALTGSSVSMTGSTISVNGGQGGDGGNASSGGRGGNGGAATVTLTGTSISLANSSSISAEGGSGSFGGNGGSAGGAGGNGGAALVTLTGGTISLASSNINANGGDGGDGGSASFGGVGGQGGNGGNATVTLAGSSITLASSSINANGGDGGDGGQGIEGADGGLGGIGGNAAVTLAGGSVSLTGSFISVSGDDGGDGGSASFGGVGGQGGNGGNATVTLAGSSITLASSSSINANGGDGGDGGQGIEGADGGLGGIGGNAAVTLAGGSVSLMGSFISVSGDDGGDGGSASSGGVGGNGGNGGSATVTITGTSISVTSGSFIKAFGGDGEDGGWNTFGGGIAGNGGNGGSASVMLTAGTISVSGGSIEAFGGSNGSGGFGFSASGAPGAGGAASIVVAATGGNVVIQNFALLRADGAEGGTSVINLVAPGDITVTSSTIQAGDTCCTPGTNGGTSTIGLAAGGNITVDGGEGLFANGGSGQMNGGVAAITLAANGGITVNQASVQAFGGSGFAGNGGDAAVTFTANGGITVNQASVRAFGGSGFAGNGGDAAVTFTANGGSILIQNTPFSIEAFGGAGPITGGSATITVVAASGIIIDGSTVNATAYPFNCVECSPPENGGLGLVSLNPNTGTVDLLNGAVVEANGGGGIVTSGSAQITMTFTGRTTGGYFIDGVEGLIVDDLLPPTTGFFVNFEPAILDTNLFVTYGLAPPPSLPPPPTSSPPPTFIDQVVVANNLNFDILADQLRGGEAGEGPPVEAKKELPVCK